MRLFPQLYVDHTVGQAARDLLQQLPSAQREAMVLAYWGALTMTEIAARTATPVGTVKTRIRSALRQLRVLTQQDDVLHSDDLSLWSSLQGHAR